MVSMAAFGAGDDAVHPPLEVRRPGAGDDEHCDLAGRRREHRIGPQSHAHPLEVLSHDGCAQPGVEGAGEGFVVPEHHPARPTLPARAGEDGVVEPALGLVELLRKERHESRVVGAHR
jgi:hypothetical protein